MKILMIRLSSLGDVVMQSPFYSWIKQQHPEWEMHFLTAPELASLVEGHPCLDKVIALPRYKGASGIAKLYQFVRADLASNQYDLIIDLHGNTRSFFIKLFLLSIPALTVDKRRIERSLLTRLKIDLLKGRPSQHTRNILDFKGLFKRNFKASELQQFLAKKLKREVSSSLSSGPKIEGNQYSKSIVISPAASFAPKRWPTEKFYALAIAILESEKFAKYPLVLLAGPGDNYCDTFNDLEIKFPGRFTNLQGKTSLKESMQILQDCILCIGNDSGPNHIAESYGRPVLTIFGPTSESFGFRSHMKLSRNISVPVWCRPCSTTGKSKCFRSKQWCFEGISVERVFTETKAVLKECYGAH